MTPEMTPDALLEVLSSIDARRWGLKHRIVAKLGRWSEGCEASLNHLAERLHTDRRAVWRHLRQLVDDRVVLELEAGAGSRPAWLAVNPVIAEWRHVPWLPQHHVELVAYRAFHGEPPRAADPTETDVVARPRPAPLAQFAARPRPAPQNQLAARPRPAPQTRGRGAPQGRAEKSKVAPESSLSGDNVTRADGSLSQEPAAPETEQFDRVAAAVTRGRGRFLNGAPRVELQRLCLRYGADAVLDLIGAIPADLGVPAAVGWLACELAAPTPPPPAPPPPPPVYEPEPVPDALDHRASAAMARDLRAALRDNAPSLKEGAP